jgi:transcriptional regulator NrdR family protein
MNMVVTHCPDCKKKLKALDSRPHFSYGFPTVKRRRCCMHCTFRTTTIELPIEIGNEVFGEE